MLTRKEAEAIIARCLTEIRETLNSCEPWNDLPEDDRIFCAGADPKKAWGFVLNAGGSNEYNGEVISVDA